MRNRTVSLAVVGLLVWVTACTSYRQIEIGEVADHDKVRITTTDGEALDYYDPRVEADSIKGRGHKDGEMLFALPLNRVSEVEVGGDEPAKTAMLVIGVIGGAALLAFLGYWIGCSASDSCLGG